ncbi:MAG TPA: NUDIX domain-containing protein [Candidatus Acidoferrum sp.]|nr:NUDIX domain-containing protein [Candidatus Acidoferrum sp.]
MSLRPDLVACWVYRVTDAGTLEFLLIKRAPGRILPGLWQCVTGSLEEGERVALGALRELVEETGFGPDQIEAFYDLDLVNTFHEPSVDAVLVESVFAARVRADAVPALSHEHDDLRWVAPTEAQTLVVWPAYHHAIERIPEYLLDPARAPWFELTLDGRRVID